MIGQVQKVQKYLSLQILINLMHFSYIQDITKNKLIKLIYIFDTYKYL